MSGTIGLTDLVAAIKQHPIIPSCTPSKPFYIPANKAAKCMAAMQPTAQVINPAMEQTRACSQLSADTPLVFWNCARHGVRLAAVFCPDNKNIYYWAEPKDATADVQVRKAYAAQRAEQRKQLLLNASIDALRDLAASGLEL